MFEGHDTTSQGLLWTIYLLAKHPSVQEKARAEIKSILGTQPHISYDQINKVTYLTAVLKESHRLYPPVPIISRVLDEEVEVLGYTLPEGTHVRIAPWSIHRNPNVWDHPNDFIPERFLQTSRENDDQPFAFVPFSAGPRNCIGQKFALNEEITILSSVLNRFIITLDETHPIELDPKLVLSSKYGIVVGFTRLVPT